MLRNKKAIFVALYAVGYPILGAIVGYACYLIARWLGRPVDAHALRLFVVVWVAIFVISGAIGIRGLVRIDALKKREHADKRDGE